MLYSRAIYHCKFQLWKDASTKKNAYLADNRLTELVIKLYNDNLKHGEILHILHKFEEYSDLKDWQLVCIHSDFNLVYCRRNNNRDQILQQATDIIRSGFESSLITQWGYRSI